MSNTTTATRSQFDSYQMAYSYFNETLFNGALPDCFLNFSRMNKTYGFYSPDRWVKREEKSRIDEISLNPDHLSRGLKYVMSTLVHEMTHLQQFKFFNPSRRGYHNAEFAMLMEQVGLVTSDTGKEGGKRTGARMTHYIQEGGAFQRAFENMPKDYLLPWETISMEENESINKKKKGPKLNSKYKFKYSCPDCKANVWGKPELAILCMECKLVFQIEE